VDPPRVTHVPVPDRPLASSRRALRNRERPDGGVDRRARRCGARAGDSRRERGMAHPPRPRVRQARRSGPSRSARGTGAVRSSDPSVGARGPTRAPRTAPPADTRGITRRRTLPPRAASRLTEARGGRNPPGPGQLDVPPPIVGAGRTRRRVSAVLGSSRRPRAGRLLPAPPLRLTPGQRDGSDHPPVSTSTTLRRVSSAPRRGSSRGARRRPPGRVRHRPARSAVRADRPAPRPAARHVERATGGSPEGPSRFATCRRSRPERRDRRCPSRSPAAPARARRTSRAGRP
jgi:hypothetical protein